MEHFEFVQTVSCFLALFFAGVFAFCFLGGYKNKNVEPIRFSDKFKIGYIEDAEPTNSPIAVQASISKEEDKIIKEMQKQIKSLESKLSKAEKSKPKKKKVNDTLLMEECISALIALGYKRSVAKAHVVNALSIKTPESAEQFLEEFFKRSKT